MHSLQEAAAAPKALCNKRLCAMRATVSAPRGEGARMRGFGATPFPQQRKHFGLTNQTMKGVAVTPACDRSRG